ncbi:MAG: VCBS repeat-containing protein, partial [Deltaproteobacteria bacterium]|nr:VCBS repeat-containing protein [Deltaproteobacteria bacterium]
AIEESARATGVSRDVLLALGWAESRLVPRLDDVPPGAHEAETLPDAHARAHAEGEGARCGLFGLDEGSARAEAALLAERAGLGDLADRPDALCDDPELEARAAALRLRALAGDTAPAPTDVRGWLALLDDWHPALAHDGFPYGAYVGRVLSRGIDGTDEAGATIYLPPSETVLDPADDLAVTSAYARPDTRLADWRGPACDYRADSRSRGDVDYVIIHTCEGGFAGCLSTVRSCGGSVVSSHYVVSYGGDIAQVVEENDVAWHVGCLNGSSIGIEHEGFAGARSHPDDQYCASARLVRSICDRWGIPCDRRHVIGHVEANERFCHGDHWDPGPHWDWSKFMRYVRDGCGCTPTRETCNGRDDDCDGRTDEGVTNACGRCGAVPRETCNGRDDDCDGRTDEGVQNACGRCGAVPDETCNGRDDDCDGTVDENVCDRAALAPSIEPPDAIDLGSDLTVSVRVTNAGTTTWRAPAYALRASGDGARVELRGAIVDPVAPGGTVEATLVVSPEREGAASIRLEVAKDDRALEGAFAWAPTVRRPPFAARFLDVSLPASLAPGGSADGWALVRNEGRDAWPRGTTVAPRTTTGITVTGDTMASAAGEEARVRLTIVAPPPGVASHEVLLTVRAPDGRVASWPEPGRTVRVSVGATPRAGATGAAPIADADPDATETALDGGCSTAGGSPTAFAGVLLVLLFAWLARRAPHPASRRVAGRGDANHLRRFGTRLPLPERGEGRGEGRALDESHVAHVGGLALVLVLLAGCTAESLPSSPLRVEGRVLDAFTHEPLAGATVAWVDGQGDTVAGEDGAFVLETTSPLPATFAVVAAEHQDVEHTLGPGTTTPVRVEISLPPGDPTEEGIDARLFALEMGRLLRDDPNDPALRPEAAAYLRGEAPMPEPADGEIGVAREGLGAPPTHIRIWRRSIDGASRSCDGRIDRIAFEDYVKGVLPHEWITSWDAESLRAGAIAIRTYSWRWIRAGGKYDCADLDDTTNSQVYRDDRVGVATRAVDATRGQAIVRSGSLVSGEYSAENGDPTADGVDEPHCHGRSRFGHGRGMCQWGSQRWATAGRDHDWIARHYWPGSVVEGGCEPRTETCNGRDDDCDGRVDEGVTNACGRCGDVPRETCNGRDDDCDGRTDEGVTNACGRCGAVPAETCNGRDDDCDGATDEDVCDRVSSDALDAPDALDLGERYVAHATLLNAGTTTWRAPAYTIAVEADGVEAELEGAIVEPIAPGGHVAIAVSLAASREGDGHVRVRVRRDGRALDEALTLAFALRRPVLGASFVDVSAPSSLVVASRGEGWVVVRNEGRQAWPAGTWVGPRIVDGEMVGAMTSTPVAPGEMARLALGFVAGAAPGAIEGALVVRAPDGTVAHWPDVAREVRVQVVAALPEDAERRTRPEGTRGVAGADRDATEEALGGGCSAPGDARGAPGMLFALFAIVGIAVSRRRPMSSTSGSLSPNGERVGVRGGQLASAWALGLAALASFAGCANELCAEGSSCEVVVDAVSPSAGSARGHEHVVLRGEHLEAIVAVRFGDAMARIVERRPDRLTVETPPGVAGHVVLSAFLADDVEATIAARFTYEPIEPVFIDSSNRLPADEAESRDPIVGDLDGDGDTDLLIAVREGRPLYYLNDGRGRFTAAPADRLEVDALDAIGAAAADVDRDGDLDVFLPVYGRAQDVLLTNDRGTLRADPAALPTDASSDHAAAFGDLDADGDVDLVVAAYGEDADGHRQERVLLNDGRGRFTAAALAIPARDDQTSHLALGDVDGDGDLDLVTANDAEDDVHVRLLLNDGRARFSEALPAAVPASPERARRVLLGDLDRDGDLDLVATGRGQDHVYLNDGHGRFVDTTLLALPLDDGSGDGAALGDLDLDGDLDLVVGNGGLPERAYMNQGDGRMVDASLSLPVDESATRAVAIADFDHDGAPDILVLEGRPERDRLLLTGLPRLALADDDGRSTVSEETLPPVIVGGCSAARADDDDHAGLGFAWLLLAGLAFVRARRAG